MLQTIILILMIVFILAGANVAQYYNGKDKSKTINELARTRMTCPEYMEFPEHLEEKECPAQTIVYESVPADAPVCESDDNTEQLDKCLDTSQSLLEALNSTKKDLIDQKNATTLQEETTAKWKQLYCASGCSQNIYCQ